MSSRILLPLDGSKLAEQALPCGMMLARELPAEMVLLRAVNLSSDVQEMLQENGVGPEAPLQQLETQAQRYLAGTAQKLEKAGLQVQTVIQTGPAAEVIVDYASQIHVGFIVMATHGYSGISRWRHGSVAERVLHAAPVPVLMMRAGDFTPGQVEHPMTCDRILVPLDGSPLAEQVLRPAADVARAVGAQVILFRVPIISTSSSLMGDWYLPLEGVFATAEADARIYLDCVAERLRDEGVEVTTVVQTGAVAEAIVSFAESTPVQLIAMCTHGRTGLARWALGSVTDRVLRATHLPLLLVRARQPPM